MFPPTVPFSLVTCFAANWEYIVKENRAIKSDIFYMYPFLNVNFFALKVKHCRELGISGDSAARLMMFFGIASFSARLLIGKLGDCKCVSSLLLIQVGSLGLAITILLLPLARAYTAFVAFSIVDGFLDGVIGSQFNLVLLTTVSPQLRATAFGYANCLASLTLTIGPSIAGQ